MWLFAKPESTALMKNQLETALAMRRRGFAEHSAILLDPRTRGLDLPTPRDQNRNHDAIATAIALLEATGETSPWILEPVLSGEYDLFREYGIRFAPLMSLNDPEDAKVLLRRCTGTMPPHLRPDAGQVLFCLHLIREERCLGRHTREKLAYIVQETGRNLRALTTGFLEVNPRIVARLLHRTAHLLDLSAARVGTEHPKWEQVQAVLQMVRRLQMQADLHLHFLPYALFREEPEHFFRIFADSIIQSLARGQEGFEDQARTIAPGARWLRGRGIETAFVPRDPDFLLLGDLFGDCTSLAMRAQVDAEVANIHWTVYSWLLDPYYRVLGVFYHGRPAIKGHIIPLFIGGLPVLMLDAIEVVPQLRGLRSGRPNPTLNREMFEVRKELLDAMFEEVRGLASKMGIETIFVEKFSNARWVRAQVDRLPSDSYHTDDVYKPFGVHVIEENIRRLTGSDPAGTVELEVQAVNLRLMDQQMRPGFKEVAVLEGRRDDWSLSLRGP